MIHTAEHIAQGLLQHLRSPAELKDEHYWAWLCIQEMIDEGDAHEAWEVILRAIQLATSDRDLKFIGAGVLESLLHRRGPEVIEAVKDEAQQDARVITALKAVYLADADEHVRSVVSSTF
jgi:hypothetical protein